MPIKYVVCLPVIYSINFEDSLYDTFQLANGRAAQHQLQIDVQNKETALGIDSVCHQMNNLSRGLQYYGGIERYDSR